MLGVNIFQRYWEMNQVEVKVVDAPELELVLDELVGLKWTLSNRQRVQADDTYALLLVVGVPELENSRC